MQTEKLLNTRFPPEVSFLIIDRLNYWRRIEAKVNLLKKSLKPLNVTTADSADYYHPRRFPVYCIHNTHFNICITYYNLSGLSGNDQLEEIDYSYTIGQTEYAVHHSILTTYEVREYYARKAGTSDVFLDFDHPLNFPKTVDDDYDDIPETPSPVTRLAAYLNPRYNTWNYPAITPPNSPQSIYPQPHSPI